LPDRSPSAEIPVGVLEIPVRVWGSQRVESTSSPSGRLEVFSEETCTVIVFPHGAVIRLSMVLVAGQTMMLTNRKSGREVPCRVVNVRKYPKTKGYAEIQFIQPMDGFWGSYVPQGTINWTEKAKLPAAKPEKPPKHDPIASEPAPIQATIETPAAPCLAPLAVAPRPLENFYHGSLPSETISTLAATVIASPDPPTAVRTEPEPIASCEVPTAHQRAKPANRLSALSWVWGLLGSWPKQKTHAQGGTDRAHAPRRTMVLAGATAVGILMLCAAGILLLRFRTATDDAVAQPDSGFSILNKQSPQDESSSTSLIPLPSAESNVEGFPSVQTPKFADNVFHRPTKKIAPEGKIPNSKLLAPHWAARSAATVDQHMPPDVSAHAPSTGAEPIQAFLTSSGPVGGRVKDPQLIYKTVPSYPLVARQSGIEGKVIVDAVIDTDGKLTDMRIVSGPALLQQAALNSLRTWKYRPGYLDEKPIQTKTSITVEFRVR
jgi:TonB family protein